VRKTYLLNGEASGMLASCPIQMVHPTLAMEMRSNARATYLTILAVFVVFFFYEIGSGTAVDTPHDGAVVRFWERRACLWRSRRSEQTESFS